MSFTLASKQSTLTRTRIRLDAVEDEQLREGGRWARALMDPASRARIEADLATTYYYTTCWLPKFYALFCYYGFVSIAQEPVYLIAEMQKEYCVLDFKNLHWGRSVRKRVRRHRYKLSVNARSDEVWSRICEHHTDNWLGPRYFAMLRKVWDGILVDVDTPAKSWFQPYTVELVDTATGNLVAGEIGYAVGMVYTSLTGFCDTEGHPSSGKIQLCAMVKHLQGKGVHFVNLGHPPHRGQMRYKTEIGAVVISRAEHLARWEKSREGRVCILGEVMVE